MSRDHRVCKKCTDLQVFWCPQLANPLVIKSDLNIVKSQRRERGRGDQRERNIFSSPLHAGLVIKVPVTVLLPTSVKGSYKLCSSQKKEPNLITILMPTAKYVLKCPLVLWADSGRILYASVGIHLVGQSQSYEPWKQATVWNFEHRVTQAKTLDTD